MDKLVEKMDGKSMDILSENISKVKELFPEVFCEDKIDFEKLKEVLGDYIDDKEEKYSFTWHGKSKAIRLSQTPSTGTLRPCKEESKNWDTTENLYIEGDNLEVLKLLQKTYHGRVKMIYIDPPYNTGNDFVYPDDYKDNLQNYLEITGQVDEEGKKLGTNSEGGGRYHTNWLNMMYPRIRLARNLLTDDGIIFISIDDNEVHNFRKICDEVFGEDNFVANIIWQKRTSPDARKKLSSSHEYISVYMKNADESEDALNLLGLEQADIDKYKNPDNDPRGSWVSTDFGAQGFRPNQMYTIKTPGGKEYKPSEGRCWKNNEDGYQKLLDEGRMWFGSDGCGVPRKKLYLSEREGKNIWTWWSNNEVGHTQEATQQLTSLLGKKTIFDYPKPVKLIKRIVQIATQKNSIIMDFFSGSATSAHAVMQLNAEDGGNRKFIMVQLPEETDEKSEAFKAGYTNICEIGKERIRRAGDKILEENKNRDGIENLDNGFKVFKLDYSNVKKWNPDYNDFNLTLDLMVDNFVPNRKEEDILYEVMLKFGIDLTYPIEEHHISGKNVYSIGFGALFACFDDHITLEVAEGIIKLKEELSPEITRVVFKDNGFKDSCTKKNIELTLKRNNIKDVMSI